MFWIGLFMGVIIGVVTLGIFRYRKDDDECRDCKAHYVGIIRDLELKVHGLKSTKGALGKELQSMAFRNAGYRAR